MRRRRRGTGTGATGDPPKAGGWGTAARPPPLSPPLLPPAYGPRGRRPPNPPEAEGTSPLPQKGPRRPGGGAQLDPRAPAPPTACSRGVATGGGNPHQRARTTHGPRPGVARDNEPEQYGGCAPHDLSVANDARNVARPRRAEGRTEAEQSPGPPAPKPSLRGGGSRAAPPPPHQAGLPAAGPTRRPGLPHDPDRTRTPGEDAPATKGGLGRGPQAALLEGGRWGGR